MKKKDKEKIVEYIQNSAKSYSYCFTYDEPNKKYMKRFANDRFDGSLWRGELVNLHLSIFEENGITDTYDGIKNEKIDEELRKFYVKVFMEEVLKQLEIRKVEEEAKKAKEKQAKMEAEGKTKTAKKNSKSKKK